MDGKGRVKSPHIFSFPRPFHTLKMLASSSARRIVAASALRFQARFASSTALNQFSDEEKMLKEAVKKWAEAEVKPHVRRMDQEKKMVRFACQGVT